MPAAKSSMTSHADGISQTTLLVLLWTFLTLCWSIFTPPCKTFAARILLFQLLWIVRIYFNESTWLQDLVLSLSLHAAHNFWSGTWRPYTLDDLKSIDFARPDFLLYLQIFVLLGACSALAGGIVGREKRATSARPKARSLETSIDEHLLPALLIPSRTSHIRLFPQRHSFSYSYLFVGIPVGITGSIGNALSVDSGSRSWFNIDSADYLERGRNHLSLGNKLKDFLHSQGVTDRDYSFAYFVTAPRFLGYSFNPVSFWYLYDSDVNLKYIILEVNNTFDERRMYILRTTTAKRVGEELLKEDSNGLGIPSKATVFAEPWEKDFHVSPFNSRKGSYSLRAIDPLAAWQDTGHVSIDNTIVLRSSKDSAKIVARVWSEGTPEDAKQISTLKIIRFISLWWWVGLITFPRIVWEAQKLFFKRKLHVWYRPEVAPSSIGRDYTSDEFELETVFRAFLEEGMEQAEKPLRLIYEPAHSNGEEIVMYSSHFTYEEDHGRTLTLKVTSPAFYSRFVHYAHAKEAFDREALSQDEKNRTLVIQSPHLLPVLLGSMQSKATKTVHNQTRLESFRWSLLRRLRCPPPDPSYTEINAVHQDYRVTDIRSFRASELDEFVKTRGEDESVYRRIVTKQFLAQRIALGIPQLLSAIDLLFRALLIFATIFRSERNDAIDVFRPRNYDIGDFGSFAVTLVLANAVHVWSLVKG